MNSHRSQLNKLFDWGVGVLEKLKCSVLLKNLTSPEAYIGVINLTRERYYSIDISGFVRL